jgi:hypothetical protein
MPKRKSPRNVYVKRYPRWVKGQRKHVRDSRRGEDHKLSVRKTKRQLKLDLDEPER